MVGRYSEAKRASLPHKRQWSRNVSIAKYNGPGQRKQRLTINIDYSGGCVMPNKPVSARSSSAACFETTLVFLE